MQNDSKITIDLPLKQRAKFNKYCKKIGSNAAERLRLHIETDILAAKKLRIVPAKTK